MNQSDVVGVISKFVGFKLLIQIQDYYLKSRVNFSQVRREVNNSPLRIDGNTERIFGSKFKTDDNSTGYEEKSFAIKICYYIFKGIRVVYTSVYYYFMPLIYTMFPLWRLINSG